MQVKKNYKKIYKRELLEKLIWLVKEKTGKILSSAYTLNIEDLETLIKVLEGEK